MFFENVLLMPILQSLILIAFGLPFGAIAIFHLRRPTTGWFNRTNAPLVYWWTTFGSAFTSLVVIVAGLNVIGHDLAGDCRNSGPSTWKCGSAGGGPRWFQSNGTKH